MKRRPQLIHLFALLFAGFLLVSALSLSISEDPIGDDGGLDSQPPLPVPLSVIPRSAVSLGGRSPSRRRILCSDDDNSKYDKLLLARSDGIIYFMDGQSRVPLWRFVTGSPLLLSKRADPNMEYFIDFGDNGRPYEYSKAFGRRELNMTFEELVHEPAIIEDSSFIFGSKVTTLHYLNVTNGEVLARHRLPGTQTKIDVPLVERKLVASRPDAVDGYILLVRTEYSLSSVALPMDPTQISPAADEPLWQLSRSDISALYIKSGQSSKVAGKLELPSCQIDIPVFFLPMACKVRGAIDEDLMLPPVSYPHCYEYRSQGSLMLPISPDFAKSVAIASQSLSGSVKMLELPDDKHLSSSSWNDLSEVDSVDGKPSTRELCGEPGNLKSQYDKTCPVRNISNMSSNSQNSTDGYLRENGYAAGKRFRVLLTGFIYRNLAMIVIPSFFVILALWLLKSRMTVKSAEKLNNLEGKQSATRKKKKTRKASNMKNDAIGNCEKAVSFENKKTGIYSWAYAQSDRLRSNLFSSLGAADGRRVGKLFVSNIEIGRGSNGTVVFEGVYDGRPVAVKRLLRAHNDVALKEIDTLILSDQHSNIVRLYGVEEDLDFVYISLERCSCNLSDLIQLFSDSSLPLSISRNQSLTNDPKTSVYYEKGIKKDLELWRADGLPSRQLLQLMRDVVAGLAHLHALGFIHRDMKPQNVLISTDMQLTAKVSDMGISKRLLDDMSSLSHNATGYGSSGWQAPEQLLKKRQSRAVDLFSLGCVLFFCITKGKHPFGIHFERDSNIINNHFDLFLVDHIPEAVDLLSQLLDPNPNLRLDAVEVFHHPFFWNSEMRLAFLRDTSDRVELEDRENESELLKALENTASAAFGGKWGEKLDAAFITDMGRYRKYKFGCTRDLLRVIRNKLNHYRELPQELQEILGSVPDGFDKYFSSRFPKLLIEAYKVIRRYCSSEESFSKYFKNTLD